jgi:hypothetical protein
LILSSEVLHGENVWRKLELGEMVGVDWRMMIWGSKGSATKVMAKEITAIQAAG